MPPPCKSGVLPYGLDVPNLDRQATTLQMADIVPLAVRLDDGALEDVDWVASIRGVLLV